MSSQQHVWVQETLDGVMHLPDAVPEAAEDKVDRVPVVPGREVPGQLALALRPEAASQPVPEELLRIRDNARRVQEEIDNCAPSPSTRRTTTLPTSVPAGGRWHAVTATPSFNRQNQTWYPPAPSFSEHTIGRATGNPNQADLLHSRARASTREVPARRPQGLRSNGCS